MFTDILADLTMFHISDYTCSAQGKYISQHGGLLIYVHNSYIYEYIIIPIQSNIILERSISKITQ